MHTPVKTWLGITIIIIVTLTAGMFIWYQQKNLAVNNQPVIINPAPQHKYCTQEAKQCPDGSYVSRTGPKCEFTPCPSEASCEGGACPEVVITGIPGKIEISDLKINDTISSPLSFSGKAVGTWFFEGSFPVGVHDSNDKLLGSSLAAFLPLNENDTWMTDKLVNFQGEIKFSKPVTDTGYILFKKDNPSGLPQNDESYKLQIKFK